ncbi:unnamed protein product [Toxocara canis]|nr:unnamed protein product [Toxocara canis]
MVEKKEKNFDNVERTLVQLAHLSLDVDDAREGPSNARQQLVSTLDVMQRQPAKKANFFFRKPNFLIRPATFNFRPPN